MLLRASRRFFYRHPGQLVLALVGMAAGIAVITGVALLRDVLMMALDAATEQLAGSDRLRIQHPAGDLDEQVFAQLATHPGSPELVPVLRVRVRHHGQPLELLGIDPIALTADGGPGLSGTVAAELMGRRGAVVVNRRTLDRLGLDIGREIDVHTGDAPHALEIVAAIDVGPGLDDRLVMDIARAQEQFSRQGRLSWILAPPEAADWLARHLPAGLVVVNAAERRDSARRLTAGMRANLSALSLLAMAVGLFVVYSVSSFLMVQRRKTFGILRAVGVTRTGLAGVLTLESALIAGMGGLLGLVAGTWLADRLLALVRGPVAELYREIPAAGVQPVWSLYLLAWAAGVAAAVAVVLPIVREAVTVPPGRMVRTTAQPAGSGRRPWLFAAGSIAAGLACLVLSNGLAIALIGVFLVLAGCSLLVPPLAFGLLSGLRGIAGRGLAAHALALLASGQRRLAPALAALTLAVALAAGMAMMILAFRGAVDDWVERLLRADVYLTLDRSVIDDDRVARIAALPGVVEMSSARRVAVDPDRLIVAYDLPRPAWDGFEWVAGDGHSAIDHFKRGESVLVTEAYARRRGLKPGDDIRITAPSGPLVFEVAAVFRDYSTDRGFIAMDAGFYRAHWDDPLRDSLGLYLSPATGGDALEKQLRDALGEESGINLTYPREVRAQTLAVFDRTFRISWAMAALVGAIALIALVSALLALGLERGRDYATLRAIGLSVRGLAGLVTLQTGTLALLAAVLAVPMSILIHLALTEVIQPRAFGWTLAPAFPPMAPLAAVFPLVIIAGLAAGLYPASKIARAQPGPMLRAG